MLVTTDTSLLRERKGVDAVGATGEVFFGMGELGKKQVDDHVGRGGETLIEVGGNERMGRRVGREA